MNFDILTLLQLGLVGAEGLLAQLKLGTDVPVEIIQDVEALIAAYNKVHGSSVTLGQIEGMRLQKTF